MRRPPALSRDRAGQGGNADPATEGHSHCAGLSDRGRPPRPGPLHHRPHPAHRGRRRRPPTGEQDRRPDPPHPRPLTPVSRTTSHPGQGVSGRRCVREHRRPRLSGNRGEKEPWRRPTPRAALCSARTLTPTTGASSRPPQKLRNDPDTRLDSIAQAAGVARRTLYGHFPSRHVLIADLAREASHELRQAFAAARTTDGDPMEAMTRMVLAAWTVGDHYRMLIALGRRHLGEDAIRTTLAPALAEAVATLRRGQREVVFADHLPAPVLAQALAALMLALAEENAACPWNRPDGRGRGNHVPHRRRRSTTEGRASGAGGHRARSGSGRRVTSWASSAARPSMRRTISARSEAAWPPSRSGRSSRVPPALERTACRASARCWGRGPRTGRCGRPPVRCPGPRRRPGGPQGPGADRLKDDVTWGRPVDSRAWSTGAQAPRCGGWGRRAGDENRISQELLGPALPLAPGSVAPASRRRRRAVHIPPVRGASVGWLRPTSCRPSRRSSCRVTNSAVASVLAWGDAPIRSR